MGNSSVYVMDFDTIDRTAGERAGGKGANLGELSRIRGLKVPGGFCVTTDAYDNVIGGNDRLVSLMEQLASLKASDRKAIAALSAEIRKQIEDTLIPEELEQEIAAHLEARGESKAYALRSSATAEDLPTASFAGQQDSYLNVIGKAPIVKHISKCWASLFTERAVIYRLQNGFGHQRVSLAVLVQEMVFPDVSGIMFTADPVSSNRKIVSIDAGFGLGEALVSGLVTADHYKVRQGRILEKNIGSKKRAFVALKEGGTKQEELTPAQQSSQALHDGQILELERLGRTIEAHFGSPQDIEWCLAGGLFYVVQSRPITTLYPIPEAGDDENHVYVSVGHNQMMTDAMKPLGLSFFQLTANAYPAGGRLFVDVTKQLASPESRQKFIEVFGKSDQLVRDALITIAGREEFFSPLPAEQVQVPAYMAKELTWDELAPFENEPELVPELIRISEASIETLKQQIRKKRGVELFDFIREDMQEVKKAMFNSKSMSVILLGMNVSSWINEKMSEWLGEKNAADQLSQSVPHNITSEMGLALLDVADVIRPYPEVTGYLKAHKDNDFLNGLLKLRGGKEAAEAIRAYLDRYGMRCVGEVDITRTRWIEDPGLLIPMILTNIKNFAPGESRRKYEQGLREALSKERELLQRLESLPDGEQKAFEAARMIRLLRRFIGYREYPKYSLVNRYFLYKQALLQEAAQLMGAGLIPQTEDVYYFSLAEFRTAVETQQVDPLLIHQRKEAYQWYKKLTPPRVMTSDGEVIAGRYRHAQLPAGAIAGLAVSSGVVEGRARVILNMEDADIEEGDILVTSFTDPSWTPVFVALTGLVTEVGGLMTHGAVVAREYGLPAVVGIEGATRLIRDGQRIRVNGTDGYVELL